MNFLKSLRFDVCIIILLLLGILFLSILAIFKKLDPEATREIHNLITEESVDA